MLVTAVAVYLEAAELHSHKLCIYATDSLVVTFERELLTGQRFHAAHEEELFKDKIFLEVWLDYCAPDSHGKWGARARAWSAHAAPF